ncbi:cupredoxin domain-containing protein [Thermorudis peleae]|uniref:cupredoxin domain-containing protein n=1 Tax=Thermorudis peleae TaxID=1382356 RepID=UPI00056F4810|nr:cupredoxin domain-containing protein [Thermorudis peleae]
MTRLHLTLAFTLVLLVLGSPIAAAPATAQGETVSLTLTEFRITPNTLSVPAGVPVTFVVRNAGQVQHNLTVELEAQGIEQTLFATNLAPGETRQATYTFSAAGTWEMYCPVDGHRQLGMQGTITVTAQAATPTAATAPSPTATPAPTALPTATPSPRATPTPALTPTSAPAAPATPTPRPAPTATRVPAVTPTPIPQVIPATGHGASRPSWLAAVLLMLGIAGIGYGLRARRRAE